MEQEIQTKYLVLTTNVAQTVMPWLMPSQYVGRAREVLDVSDSRNIKGNTGQRQNEYNYGEGTPDVKSLFNTGEFIPNAGFNRKNGGILNKRVILRNKI